MNKKQPKKNLKKIISEWKQRFPVVFFVGLFTIIIIVFYAIFLSQWFTIYIQGNINKFNAWISSNVLYLLGQHTSQKGETIFSSAFSITVARGCDGIEGMAIYISAVLAFPLSWKKKRTGVFMGLFLLFILNIIRVISLFLVGVYSPKMFEVMHVEVWQALFIILAVGLWVIWIYYSTKTITTGNA